MLNFILEEGKIQVVFQMFCQLNSSHLTQSQ